MTPTLYLNGFPSVYEELKTFYPVFYRDVFEMDAIWRVCGGKMDEIEDDVDRVANSAFVATMDERLLAQMEVFLQIPPDPKRSLRDRRNLVASFFLGNGHIGAPEIKEIASAFTDGEVIVTFENGTVGIRIIAELGDEPPESDFYYIMRKKIPAHLGIWFNIASDPIVFIHEYLGLALKRFIFKSKFSHLDGVCVTLDGSKNLDGSFTLNQQFVDGIDMQRVIFGPGSSAGILLNGAVDLDGSIKLNQRARSTWGWLHEQTMTAAIVYDTLYYLDGSVLLDGSRQLNADYIKEEL